MPVVYNSLFFKEPLAKDAHIFRRTTLISSTRNHCAPPIGAGVSTARLRRLRGLRVTRLCRCRVRLCRSRSSRLRIAGLYRRSGSGRRNWRGRCNRCRVGRRHSSRTVAGTVLGIGLVAGRDLLRLFNRHFVVGAFLTSSRRDGCIPGGNSSYLPIGVNSSNLLIAGRPLNRSLGSDLLGGNSCLMV